MRWAQKLRPTRFPRPAIPQEPHTPRASTLYAPPSTLFDITPAAVDTLEFVQQPTDALAGAFIAPAVTVRAMDAYSNLVNNQAVALTTTTGVLMNGTLTHSGRSRTF